MLHLKKPCGRSGQWQGCLGISPNQSLNQPRTLPAKYLQLPSLLANLQRTIISKPFALAAPNHQFPTLVESNARAHTHTHTYNTLTTNNNNNASPADNRPGPPDRPRPRARRADPAADAAGDHPRRPSLGGDGGSHCADAGADSGLSGSRPDWPDGQHGCVSFFIFFPFLRSFEETKNDDGLTLWCAHTHTYNSGVAIGSSIGHVVGNGISSLFGGSGSSAPEPAQSTQAQSAQTNNSWGSNCQGATEQFTKCMDEHGGNMQICGWYLEQLVRYIHTPFLSQKIPVIPGWPVGDLWYADHRDEQKACQAAASQY